MYENDRRAQMMDDTPKAAYNIPGSRRLEDHEKQIAELRERINRLEAWFQQILVIDTESTVSSDRFS
jgi:hypothetical protein